MSIVCMNENWDTKKPVLFHMLKWNPKTITEYCWAIGPWYGNHGNLLDTSEDESLFGDLLFPRLLSFRFLSGITCDNILLSVNSMYFMD